MFVYAEMPSSVRKVSNILHLWWRNFTSFRQFTVCSTSLHFSTQLHHTSLPAASNHALLICHNVCVSLAGTIWSNYCSCYYIFWNI